MSANFNYYLNRQGLRGRKGEKGDPGEGVTVEIGQNTANTFTLLVTTQDGTFETPNLRGSLINTSGGGTYLRYDPDTDDIYTANIDEATDETQGVVRLATSEELAEASGEGVISVNSLGDGVANILIGGTNISVFQDEETGKITISSANHNSGQYDFHLPLLYTETTTSASNNITIEGDDITVPYAANRLVCVKNGTETNYLNWMAEVTYDQDTGLDFTNAAYIDVPYVNGALVVAPGSATTNGNPTIAGQNCGFLLGYTDGSGNFTPKAMVSSGASSSGGAGTINCTTVDSDFGQGIGTGYYNAYFYSDTKTTMSRLLYNYAGAQYGIQSSMYLHVLEIGNKYTLAAGCYTNSIAACTYPASYTELNIGDIGEINTIRCMVNRKSGDVTFSPSDFKSDIVSTQKTSGATMLAALQSAALFNFGTISYNSVSLKYDDNTIKMNQNGQLYAATQLTVDGSLSTQSTNPVQNRVITTSINSITGDISTLQTNVGNLQNTIDGGEV